MYVKTWYLVLVRICLSESQVGRSSATHRLLVENSWVEISSSLCGGYYVKFTAMDMAVSMLIQMHASIVAACLHTCASPPI